MSDYYFNSLSKSTNVRNKNSSQRILHALFRMLWFLTPGLTRWLTQRVFFSPKKYRTNAEEEACLRHGRRFQIEVHNKTIQAWQWGQGPAVLMVHGWSGGAAQFSHFIEPLVRAGYTAVALDGPAHGASSGRLTSYFEFTDVIRKFLNGGSPLAIHGVIAHSFGAAVAINALVKEAAAPKTICVAPVLRLRQLMFNAFEQYGIPPRLYNSLIREFEERYGYNLTEDDPLRLVKELSGSMLIVHDVKDRTIPFRDSAAQVESCQRFSLFSTEGLGHRKVLNDARVVRRCVAYMSGEPGQDNDQKISTGVKK